MPVLKPGVRLKSAVCATQVMIIRGPVGSVQLCCGGVEMIAITAAPVAGVQLDTAHAGGSLIGKRYVDGEERYEILCTQSGEGSLSLDGQALMLKQAKALPSSD